MRDIEAAVDQLIAARDAKKLNNNQIAHATGISQQSIARYMRREVDPPLSNFIRVAEYLGFRLTLLDTNKQGRPVRLPLEILPIGVQNFDATT